MTRKIPIQVLYSPSTKRVVWSSGGASLTSIVEDGVIKHPVHSADIDVETMSKSFTNEDIDDWESRIIQTWKELEKHEEQT